MSKDAVHPEVLNGRNPWWREAWEELPSEERLTILAAFKRGDRIPDHRLPFAYGLLAIQHRRLRWMPVRFLFVEAFVGAWIYFTCFRRPSLWCWMYVSIAVAGLVAFLVGLVLIRRRVRRAEKANLWARRRSSRGPVTDLERREGRYDPGADLA